MAKDTSNVTVERIPAAPVPPVLYTIQGLSRAEALGLVRLLGDTTGGRGNAIYGALYESLHIDASLGVSVEQESKRLYPGLKGSGSF